MNRTGRHIQLLVTAIAAEASVAAAHTAAEVVGLQAVTYSKSQDEDIAAVVRIQAAFRGYLAKREIRAFRGLLRLQTLMGGHSLKQQAAETLQQMQTMARLRFVLGDWILHLFSSILEFLKVPISCRDMQSWRLNQDHLLTSHVQTASNRLQQLKNNSALATTVVRNKLRN